MQDHQAAELDPSGTEKSCITESSVQDHERCPACPLSLTLVLEELQTEGIVVLKQCSFSTVQESRGVNAGSSSLTVSHSHPYVIIHAIILVYSSFGSSAAFYESS